MGMGSGPVILEESESERGAPGPQGLSKRFPSLFWCIIHIINWLSSARLQNSDSYNFIYSFRGVKNRLFSSKKKPAMDARYGR